MLPRKKKACADPSIFQAHGVDIFVQTTHTVDGLVKKIQDICEEFELSLKLKMVASRGMQVYPAVSSCAPSDACLRFSVAALSELPMIVY